MQCVAAAQAIRRTEPGGIENMATENSVQERPQTTAEVPRTGEFFRPSVDVIERPDELLIVADVPGADASAIDIHFEDRSLTIEVPVAARQGDATKYLLREYGVGGFRRQFQIGDLIDGARIHADYDQG